ncbi:hypothetical protein HanRHA438_Chr03g0106531 [Helianthus annuus]|nr:hypothetical protein HanHA300_Chr03g0079731 [Helianthus annuus]KAJ0599377.1 hypothetical protein HanIR_Chr03g0104181 [Helianthus annuus]KAJ0606974.1 hypothetical protein HanHA89_Chr03g0091161 [Helianthus annuus]KAJ0767033.1 hypothetical protein HanLR1_Chr03g0084411 [Helianthus annuus]KAJ0934360.1 hypothetical protein HanRHA438_Chr03g0106531 [Helianthus annuus]
MRFTDGDVKEVSSGGSMRLLPSSSRRFLDRFWVVGMGQRHGETRTSGSSQSKFSSSSSRKQRLGERLRSTLGNAKRFQACLFLKILNLVVLKGRLFILLRKRAFIAGMH